MGGEMKAGLRTSAQAAIMRAVHGHPGVTRAQVAAEIGIPSGFAAETVARLVAARLVCERPAPSTGRRGRPTTSLCAHPDGPLVAAAAITHDTWQIAAVQLGGTKLAATVRPHHRNQGRVLDAVAAELDRVNRRFGARVRAAAVAVPGTVVGSKLVHAPGLGWHGIDLSALWPRYEPGREFVAGNDATLAGVAESRHGACAGAGIMGRIGSACPGGRAGCHGAVPPRVHGGDRPARPAPGPVPADAAPDAGAARRRPDASPRERVLPDSSLTIQVWHPSEPDGQPPAGDPSALHSACAPSGRPAPNRRAGRATRPGSDRSRQWPFGMMRFLSPNGPWSPAFHGCDYL